MLRVGVVLVAALCATALSPLTAQQAVGPAPTATASTASDSSPSATLPGPRLQPEWRSFEPTITTRSASRNAPMSDGGGSHTIVLSTLALILVVVIIVLLVAK